MTTTAAGTDRFADLPAGPRIRYRVDGPPLLLVAGLGLDLVSWPQGMGHHLSPGVVDRLVGLTADLVRTTAGGTR